MADNQNILKKVADLEAMAYAMLSQCQQTRELLEKADVSTAAANNSKSEIAMKARIDLRSKILK